MIGDNRSLSFFRAGSYAVTLLWLISNGKSSIFPVDLLKRNIIDITKFEETVNYSNYLNELSSKTIDDISAILSTKPTLGFYSIIILFYVF